MERGNSRLLDINLIRTLLFTLALMLLNFAVLAQYSDVSAVYRIVTSWQKVEVVHTSFCLACHPDSGQASFIVCLHTVLG